MTDVILRISGMDCGACAVRIVCALRGLPGVHAVFVSDTAGCARLTYDEAAVGLGEIARCSSFWRSALAPYGFSGGSRAIWPAR